MKEANFGINLKSMKILVVEDEISLARVIKKGLEMEHYKVELAHDGEKGLAMAEKNNNDLIILDVMLPKINGIKICETLRNKNINTPIIFLTASDMAEAEALGCASKADGYLVKPFVFNELISSIKALQKRDKGEKTSFSIDKNIETAEDEKLSKVNKKIMDNAPVSIITINKDGYITSANRYFETFSKTDGYRNHNIFESEFFIRENLVDDYKQLLTKGKIVRRENCYEKNKKGEDKYLKIIAVPLWDEHGNIEGALSMAVDNTEAILFKNKLRELNNGLEKRIKQRTVELDKSNKDLAKVLNLKSMFMADVSHEVRTSLAIIQGNLELTNLSSAAKVDNETYDQIFNEIKRISTMLADLTLLSNSESSTQKLHYEKIDLNRLIDSVCKSLKVIADEKNISLKHEIDANNIEIIADKGKLERLLMNLIKNAIRYNNNNGWVNIRVETSKKEIILKIKDSGIGIPEADLPHIFERFYRVDKARTRKEGGSGLGLAICKSIAETHGGSIKVESQIGKGSLFIVRLPRE